MTDQANDRLATYASEIVQQQGVIHLNKIIADHALAGLGHTGGSPANIGLNVVFGGEDWAHAQWHLARMHLLVGLRDADPARAVDWVREQTLAGLALPDGDGPK